MSSAVLQPSSTRWRGTQGCVGSVGSISILWRLQERSQLDHLRVTGTDLSSRPSLRAVPGARPRPSAPPLSAPLLSARCERVFSVLAALEALHGAASLPHSVLRFLPRAESQAELDSQGLAFARDDRLGRLGSPLCLKTSILQLRAACSPGFLGPDPSLLGTCLTASVALRLETSANYRRAEDLHC